MELTEDQSVAMSAIAEFGYTLEEDGSLVKYKGQGKRPTDKYVPVEGGFLRFVRQDGEWAAMPHSIAPAYEGASGLTHEKHPQCFEFVYPPEFLLNIYAEAVQARE